MRLDRGAVVLVALDPTIGHEQRGVRPCVVVSDPDADQRSAVSTRLRGSCHRNIRRGTPLSSPGSRAERAHEAIVRAHRPAAIDRQKARPQAVRRSCR